MDKYKTKNNIALSTGYSFIAVNGTTQLLGKWSQELIQ